MQARFLQRNMAGVIEILQTKRVRFQHFPIKNEEFNDLPIGNHSNLVLQNSDTTPTPLVITKADYNVNFRVGSATYNTFQTSPPSVTVPTKGENQTWDFSKLAEIATFPNGGATSPTIPATFFSEISDVGSYDLGYSQDAALAISVPSLGATINYAVQN